MIELYELGGLEDRRYSSFSWRTRLALAHKELAFSARPVLMTDKAAIAFSGGTTVPVIRDGETVVRDSWQIAEYLERVYPDRRSLFGGPTGHALCRFFNAWTDRVVMPAAFLALACDAIQVQDPADRAHFTASVEKFAGVAPEALRPKQAEHLARLGKALEPARATLKRQAFVGGDAPCYADYGLASVFQWARIVSPVAVLPDGDPLGAWFERVLDLHDGAARRTVAFR